jgi:hypothetical protein
MSVFDAILDHLPPDDAGEDITAADSFPAQWERYVTWEPRFSTTMTSRRGGKSTGAVVRTAKKSRENPGRKTLYINLTAANAYLQFVEPLLDLLKRKRIPHRYDGQLMIVHLNNGSMVMSVGCDDIADVRRKLGFGWDEVIVDEMQDHSDRVLAALIDKSLLPTLADRRGSLRCQGTPPITEAGFWFDLRTKSNFAHHSEDPREADWTVSDNPTMASAGEEEYAARGIGPDAPIYQREMLGRICVDPNSMVFCYLKGRNDLPTVPDGYRPPGGEWWSYTTSRGVKVEEKHIADPRHPAWRNVLGLDLGTNDHDCIVVLGWRTDDPLKRLHERWTWQQNDLDVDELAVVFMAAVEFWTPVAICGDNGGLGKKVIKTLKARFGDLEIAQKPTDVLMSVRLVNDELRTGRLLVDPEGLIAGDAKKVVWKEGKHGVEISEAFHSDVMPTLRYAQSVALNWTAKEDDPPKTQDEIDRLGLEARKQRQEAMIYG